MIRYVLRRFLATVPTLVGISLVTFVILNLSMATTGAMDPAVAGAATARMRLLGMHLPLFLNFSIEDARSRAESEIARLKNDVEEAEARRTIAKAGGAWLPHIIPLLPKISEIQQERALLALEDVAKRIDLDQAVAVAKDKRAFWADYYDTYGSDFSPVRAARLTRRIARRPDQLAKDELLRLDTFCLPQLMETLQDDISPEAKARIVSLLQEIVDVYDPLDPEASRAEQEAVVARWGEWWNQRRDRYIVFEGLESVLGTVTETRYFKWLVRVTTFDFGVSIRDGRPILSKLAERLPVTLLLSVLALLVAYGIAIPLGIVSAVRRGGIFDRTATVTMFVLYSFPAFWMAVLLLRYFASTEYLNLFPAQGLYSVGYTDMTPWQRVLDTARHLVLPVFCLSFVPMAMLARFQRVGMLQVINLDFMRTARAKGLSRTQAILRHGLRNGVIPVVTMLGLQIPYLVSGSVVVERIFGIPGMGYETFEAIRAHDQPWLMAVVTVTAVLTLVGVVASDAIYAVIDPRIAPGSSQEVKG